MTEQTAVVTLTDAAAAKLRSIMAEKNLSDYGLRVFVQGGGCSGFQYGMTFDNNPRDVDIVFEQAGLRMIVDPRSIDYIAGANIDYVDSLMGGGFQIDNPNAVSTCGCGNSFRTKDENGEEVAGGCSSCR
ncbi:MAG TPA: iron-sulfur cluster insertion protein ErpA [Anaerolineae bacterium]